MGYALAMALGLMAVMAGLRYLMPHPVQPAAAFAFLAGVGLLAILLLYGLLRSPIRTVEEAERK